MREDHVLCLSSKGFHRVHYVDWGDPAADTIVICVHGLTRNCRDFDDLARALAPDLRVVCPDIAGRGESDWLANKDDYGYPQYCADMAVLIARVTASAAWPGLRARIARLLGRARAQKKRIYWVGTSMGGIIGMVLAAQAGSPIEKLVLNDVGAVIPRSALERIATYVGKNPRFASFEELEAYMRAISAPFGPLTDAQWRHLALHAAKRHEDGSWSLRYDPEIAAPFRRGLLADVDLWRYYDAVTCPTLLLRGAQSDLLPRETAIAMTQRGPKPKLVEFEGVGHAPMLMARDQIEAVRTFLLAG
ncbi:MAG TPA: alpha/beta hydrolase [Burkholderiales bacterium]|nr:alpha/beta hydrolase [Burkholderiales bacterium]